MDRQTQWQLNRVDDIAWKPDGSGLSVLINWDSQTESVRLDIIRENGAEPLQSFIGKADNVRKASMWWFAARISLEHAAYIGSELERADTERIDYVQD